MPQNTLFGSLPVNVDQSERWLSAAAGVGLAAVGLRQRGPIGWLLAGLGAAFIFRGSSGYCAWYDAAGVNKATHHRGFHVDESIWIDVPREELFAFCRDFSNLPLFLEHLQTVEVLNTHFSRWTAKAPGGFYVEWETEIINEHPNELITWRSLPGARVEMAGTLRLRDEEGGTRLRLNLQYDPPGGVLGALAARFLDDPSAEIQNDLSNLKYLLESVNGVDSEAFQA